MARYPSTRRDDTLDLLHGRPIADPYRWLEDPDAAETADWVRRQNEFSEIALAQLPGREWFAATMRSIISRPRAGVPFTRGGRYFVTSISTRDYPVMLGTTLLLAFVVASVNLIVDLLYAAVDPRIRYR